MSNEAPQLKGNPHCGEVLVSMSLLFDNPSPTEYTDEELLTLSLSHPNLFGVLVARYQDAFLRKVESILHNREESEEVVQEAFTKIYLYAGKFKKVEGASFKSWAYRIVVNTALTRYQVLKKRREVTAELDPEFYEMLPDLRNEKEEHEIRDVVISVLARMPTQMARALRLHIIERRPQEEVAAMEGVSVGALKTRIHRAKKEFKVIAESLGL